MIFCIRINSQIINNQFQRCFKMVNYHRNILFQQRINIFGLAKIQNWRLMALNL
ncbi:hypothetical protein pb186bvf_012286 [Paramecium bursaria]